MRTQFWRSVFSFEGMWAGATQASSHIPGVKECQSHQVSHYWTIHTHTLSGCHLDRTPLRHQTNIWFFCNQPGWKFQKCHNDLFSFAMLRYVLNLAFLTTATNIQKHPLLLCYCLDFLCLHCPPPIRHSCHVDDSYNLNKQEKGKWKQEGKETSAYSLARLAPLPFAFSDWIKLVTKGVCREKRSAGKVETHWSLRSPDTALYKNKQTPLMLKCINSKITAQN